MANSDRAARVAGRLEARIRAVPMPNIERADLIARAIRRAVKRAVEEERSQHEYLGSIYGVSLFARTFDGTPMTEQQRKVLKNYLDSQALIYPTDPDAAIRARGKRP